MCLSGGRSTGGETWGNVDYTLNVDTEKLGLWPGGFFMVQADTGFGTDIFADSGALVPVNTAALFPAPDDHTTALTNATFMQFLSEQFGARHRQVQYPDCRKRRVLWRLQYAVL